MSQHIAVFGAGSWGKALAAQLERQQHNVSLWSHRNNNLAELAQANDWWLLAIPSLAFAQVCAQLKPYVTSKKKLIWGTKGLSVDGEGLHTTAKQLLGDIPMAILSGPSFAKEVQAGLPTAVVAASEQADFTAGVSQLFHSDTFRVYQNHDVLGVELCGVVKNTMAVAAGVADGLGLGANAQAALVTRGLAEMMRLVTAAGGQAQTVMGLAGMGDLVLTCTDNQSRNRRLGVAIGQGQAIEAAMQALGGVAESYRNTKILSALAIKHQIDMPISQQVHGMLYEGISAVTALQSLLAREPKVEAGH